MKKPNNLKARAEKQLAEYLEEALDASADSIILEYVPEGLEICFMLGDTGAGRVVKDFKLAGALMQLIADRAGLETKSKGAMIWEIHGAPVKIAVEEYVSFGECCFRLNFSKRKGKAR